MARGLALLAVLLAIGVAGGLWLTRATGLPYDEFAGLTGDATRGADVFHAAGCASCHVAEGAEAADLPVLSGGQSFPSDFGTFHAPNVSMNPDVGIGGWTLAQFGDAMQAGVSPDGAHYYPAFPYSSYRFAEQQDVADLWAFWQDLPASDAASLPHDLGFPFSIRRSVGVWKRLALPDGWATPDPATPEATRGRYLSEALGHCGECHTPRDGLGRMDRDRFLAGAPNPSGRGSIPNVTPAELDWSEGDIAAYLTSGFTPEYDSAGGHMVAVIRNLARLPNADRAAIAAYLVQVPPAE
ncbi:MAG: cytochrome c [Jannaschia sp.]